MSGGKTREHASAASVLAAAGNKTIPALHANAEMPRLTIAVSWV